MRSASVHLLRPLVLLISCGIPVGCSTPADRSADGLDVLEAVFRLRLQNHPAEARAFLAVDGGDPPSALMERLRKDWPNVAPASGEPKEKGLRLYADGLKWLDRNTAELESGYWIPTRFAGEGYFADYRVTREKGRWVVQKPTNETMS